MDSLLCHLQVSIIYLFFLIFLMSLFISKNQNLIFNIMIYIVYILTEISVHLHSNGG